MDNYRSSCGAEIRYEVTGHGEPLVLIPGFASGAWSWNWQLKDLAKDQQVITFDPPGIAGSRIEEGSKISIESIADDVASLLDHLGIEAANVLGISFGGFVAQEFALRYPAKVLNLILASTSFGGPNHVAPSIEVLAAFASTDGLNSADRIRRYITMAFTPEFAAAGSSEVDRFCELREQNIVPEDAYRQQLASAVSFNVEDKLHQIKARTLVVTGAKDTVVPMQNSLNIVERMPNARLAVIEDAGHMAFVEKAAQFNELVRSFLKEQR